MRSKFFSYAILAALIGTLNLTTGCAWWKKHFGKKGSSEQGGAVSPIGVGDQIPGGERRTRVRYKQVNRPGFQPRVDTT